MISFTALREKLETSDKQNNALRLTIHHTQLHVYYRITSSLASVTVSAIVPVEAKF